MLVPTFLAGVCIRFSTPRAGQAHAMLMLGCLTLTTALWFGRITTYWVLVADVVPKEAAGPSTAIAHPCRQFRRSLGPVRTGWLRAYDGQLRCGHDFWRPRLHRRRADRHAREIWPTRSAPLAALVRK